MAEEKTLQQKLHEPWNFDRVVAHAEKQEREAQSSYQNVNRMRLEFEQKLRDRIAQEYKRRGIRKTKAERERAMRETLDEEGHTQEANSLVELAELAYRGHRSFAANVRAARPFLVGAATIESLFNQEPESYDFIEEGKLPFDNLFFDFATSHEMELPFIGGKRNAIGLSLIKTPYAGNGEQGDGEKVGLSPMQYSAQLFFDNLEHLTLRFQGYHIFKDSPPLFLMGGGMNGKFNFNADFVDGVVRYSTNADLEKLSVTDRVTHYRRSAVQELVVPRDWYPHSIPYAESDAFKQIPNFCVNLINYINAHNIQVIQRNRGKYVPYDGEDTERLPADKRPFHLITVRDGVVEEPQERSARSWDLKWRVFVRGHPVKYRDDKGQIYLTTWRSPHIRGPPSAPWRETRYEVLAAKLEAERAMYRGHGVKE